MALLLLLGIATLFAFLLTLTLGTTARRVASLVALGFALGAGWLAYAYFSAPSESAARNCSDCYLYLGRWWEPGFAVFIVGFSVVCWIIGVAVGWTARLTARRFTSRL